MEFIYPKVTIDDLLKYAKAGDHAGVCYVGDKRIELTEKEHSYAEFLYDIDTILAGYNNTFNGRITNLSRAEFLKGKSESETRAYLQGQIDNVVAMYCDRYLPYDLCERKSITLDKSGKTSMDPYVMQHILQLNGFSIDNFEAYKRGNVAGKEVPVKFTGEFVDEEALKKDFERKGIRGGSYMKSVINDAKWRDQEKTRE